MVVWAQVAPEGACARRDCEEPEEPGHTERRPKPVVDQAVKARYLERVSTPPEPRVMGGCSRGHRLSVDRGRCRLGIELRNQL